MYDLMFMLLASFFVNEPYLVWLRNADLLNSTWASA